MTSARLPLSLVCLALLLGAGGCAEATIATASTIAGIAATGISTGADVYRLGKLDSVDMADFDEWVEAVRGAAGDLKLILAKQEHYETGRWRCTMTDDRGAAMRIYIDRRTEKLCRTRIDVGVFGSEPTARLLLARIRQKIPTTQPVGADSVHLKIDE